MSSAFPGAMAFPDNGCPVRLHRETHPGDVDGQEGTLGLPGEHALGFDGLSGPAVKAEDPVGLRDGVPALDIGQLPAMGLPAADVAAAGLALERLDLFC